MTIKLRDMTQQLQKTTRMGVGCQRWQQPVYVELLPPCNHACPAGENIQAWLAHAQAGDTRKPGKRWWKTTHCPPPTAVLVTIPVKAHVIALIWTNRWRSMRSSTSSVIWRPNRVGRYHLSDHPAARKCWWSGQVRVGCHALTISPGWAMPLRSMMPTTLPVA